MTPSSSTSVTAPVVWVAPEDRLVARRSGDTLVVEDTSAFMQGVLSGTCVADFVACASGAATPPARARLEAIARLSKDLSAQALATAAAGRFRPAAIADLLRRDGWGQLWIELTAQCNERCVHCYAESSPERTEHLDRDTVFRTLAEAAELGFAMVQFTGGDPLLCPFLPDAAARARELGLGVEVYTNGLALSDALLEALAAQDVAFAFSLYADRAAEHDAVTRTPGSHARTSDAVRRAIAAGRPVRVAVIAMGENVARVADAVRYAREELGVAAGNVGADVQHAVGRGAFDPAIETPDDAAPGTHRSATPVAEPAAGAPAADAADAPWARRGAGRLCVGPDGTVWPCIFSRWVPLGRIDTARGLPDVLAAATPQPGWVRPSIFDTGCRDSLQCGECRTAAAALATIAEAAR